MPNSRRRTRAGSLSIVLAFVAGLLMATPGASYAAGRFSLRNAPIPASCTHAATRLEGYEKDFGSDPDGPYNGFAWLDYRHARYGKLRGHKGKVAVVPLGCTAGGVSWPELILFYAPGPRLIGSVNLARIKTVQEHEDVAGLRFTGGRVAVRWNGYEGAGFDVSTYRGTLGWKRGRVRLAHTGPLTIDYSAGYDPTYSSDWSNGTVQDAGDAKTVLYPAPKDFRRYIQHRWALLDRGNAYCSSGNGTVSVERYSRQRFAIGTENACGGARYLWGRTGGRWRVLWAGQEAPSCGSLSKVQRRGLTAVGDVCINRRGSVVTLGHWPTLG